MVAHDVCARCSETTVRVSMLNACLIGVQITMFDSVHAFKFPRLDFAVKLLSEFCKGLQLVLLVWFLLTVCLPFVCRLRSGDGMAAEGPAATAERASAELAMRVGRPEVSSLKASARSSHQRTYSGTYELRRRTERKCSQHIISCCSIIWL